MTYHLYHLVHLEEQQVSVRIFDEINQDSRRIYETYSNLKTGKSHQVTQTKTRKCNQ